MKELNPTNRILIFWHDIFRKQESSSRTLWSLGEVICKLLNVFSLFSPHKNLIPHQVFILSFLLASATYAQEGNVPDAVEYQALVDLYNATDGPNWNNNTNWLNGTTNTDFATWYGVTVENGDVVDIEFLNGNNLIGTLPSSIGDLTELNMLWLGSGTGTVPLIGNIPSSISQLANLHTLDIAISSPYIDEINQLGNLTYLSLNGITSEISSGISNLTNLTFLSIQESEITYIPTEVGQLVNLVTLNISFNTQLDSQIPSELGNITSLANLLLLENDLTGTIPSELGNITGLQAIWLGRNRLSGAIPTSLSNIPALELFRVEGNNLYSAPDFNSGNHNIQFLDLGQNAVDFGTLEPNFTGPGTHPFPTFTYSPQAEIGEEQNLAFALGAPFDISFTTGGTRNFYQWQKKDAQDAWQDISGATTSDFSKATFEATDIGEYRVVVTNEWVTDLNLYSKPIHVYQTDCGVVPDALEYQALVDLYNATNGSNWNNNTNWLQGNTCTDFDNWYGVTVENGDVTQIVMANNNLDGTLPGSLSNLKNLVTLTFFNSRNLTGPIPVSIGQLNNLQSISINYCSLEGQIPNELSNLNQLVHLSLNDNQLVGTIPNSIFELTELRTLSFASNNLNGTIPNNIGDLVNLEELYLNNNNLESPIPSSFYELTSLSITWLGYNEFNESLSSSLGDLTSLETLHLNNNSFTGSIPESIGNLSGLQSIDLGWNQMDGELPQSIYLLSNLKILGLRGNNFSGVIANDLDNLQQLENFNAEQNSFTGVFPSINSTSLKTLSLASNFFESIPNLSNSLNNLEVALLGTNNLDFGSLESNFTGAGTHPFQTFSYSPQAEIGEEQNLAFVLGAPFDIPFTTGGTRNFYQWQKKDAQDAWQNISGATTSDFSKATFEASDIGEYRVVVTNEWVTGLTLYSKSIFVYQTDCGVVPDALEYQALVDLYNATNGVNWTNNTNWLQGNTCSDFANWYGVTVENGDVTVIQLPSNNLDGTLPLSIFNLTELRAFDIVNNSVFGSIPSEFARLDKLVELVLANNEFSGTIPVELWSLTGLQILRLNNNQLVGELSALVGNLSDLRTLKLEHNSITGDLPNEINSLLNLQEITVGNNLLSGELGSKLSALSGLRSIHMEANSFSGEFPDYLVNIFNAQATVQMILNNNLIDHFPDFSSNQNANQTDIRLANNQLDFGDIEPNFSGVNTHPYAFFTYSPQAEIGEGQNLAYALGAPFDIPFTTGGTRNFYQWQKKDAQDIWQDIPGATSSSFTKTSFEASDVGEYRVVVTNEWVTDLTLYSKVFTVIDVSDCPGGVVTIAPMILPDDGSGNGTITLQVSSNASPYTYSWSGGLPGQKNHIGTVAAGTYSVIVTGSDGCSTPLSNLIVGDLSCQGLSANATVDGQSITINATGGAAPYTYYLSPFYVSKNTNQDTRPPGIYDAYVTDANGCSTFIDNIVVPGAPGCVNYATLTGNIYCNNPDSAKFILYVNDGVGPIDYLLLPHGSSLPSPQFSGTASVGLNEIEVTGVELDDFYYAVVTDRGCAGGTFSNLVRLEFYPDPELSVVTQIDDGNGNGTIDLTVTGGTAPYTFSWSGGLPAQEDHIGTAPAGTYSVTMTDANGCSSILDGIVVPNENCNILISADVTPVTVTSGAQDGAIDLTVSGGTPPYSFQWSHFNFDDVEDVFGVTPGVYSVIVTDQNNCSAELADIFVPSLPGCVSVVNYSLSAFCENVGSGSLTIDIQDGTGLFTVMAYELQLVNDQWNIGNTVVYAEDVPLGSSIFDISPYGIGNKYFVTITDMTCGGGTYSPILTVEENSDDNTGESAGPDQSICTQTTAMAASGATGQWTQESGPSQAIFAAPTSPTSQVTLGKPGLYTFGWTTTDAGCSPGADEVTIIYEPNFSVDIEPSDGRKLQQLSRGRFYNPDGAVTNGDNYPTEGGAIYDGIAFSSSTNKLFVASRHVGIWVLDRNIDHGSIITTTTPVAQGDQLNQIESRSLFVDDENRILYSSGWPSGTNAGALWRYDMATGEGMAFYPGFVPPGGGDPFPNTIGDEVKRIGNKVYLAAYRYNSTIPDGGIYIYDESDQSGKFMTPENTAPGGIYEVIGDPIPSNKCHTTVLMNYGGKEYLVLGFQHNQIWQYNITDNMGTLLTPDLTQSGGALEVIGDPMPEIDAFNFRASGSLLMALSWNNGIWLYDLRSDQGKLLTRESTLPGGQYEVIGDAIPFNTAVGLDFDPISRNIYIGFELSKDSDEVGVLGTGGGIWEYNLSSNEAKLHKTPNVGHFFADFLNRPVRFDRLGSVLYGTSAVSTPGSGVNVYDLAPGSYICNGQTIELKAGVTGSSAVTYQWYESGSPIAGATNSTYSTSSPGFYTVLVTEGSCSYLSEPFIVGEAGFDNLTIWPEGPVALCEGSSTLLSVPSGYAGYQWYKDGTPVTGANINSIEVSELNAGSYTVEATTSEGCTGTSLNSVSVAPGNFNVTYTKSFDHEVGFGSIDLTITGGTTPYSFSWSDGLDPVEDQILNLPIGFYDVTVTDANGCTKSLNNIGIGFDQCSFNIATSVTRDDGSGNGAIDLTVTGGTAPYTFTWSGGLPAQEDQTGLTNGIYRVMVSDATGCEESLFINLSDNCPDILSYQILSSDVRCAGANNGIIAVIVTEGVPPYEFELFDIETGNEVPALPILKPLANNVGIFGGLASSEYVVGIRQPECDFLSIFESRGIIIREPEELAVTYVSTGDNSTGTGTIDISVSGGTTPYTYLWSDGGSTLEDRTGLAAGAYSVEVTDARFCTFELDDIFVEDANNCSRSHPMRFLMGLESATELVCNDGTSSGEITVNLGFVNSPPFSGVSYTFRLVENDGSFDPHTNSGGTLIQEFANVIPTADLFSYTFFNIPPTVDSYVVTVTANGITPPQEPNCLFGSYGFVKDIIVKPAPVAGSSFTTNHSLLRIGEVIGVTAGQFVNGYTYRYDWNDGNTTTTKRSTAKHRFDAAGDFDINLTVTTDLGCVSQSTQSIRVFDYICESPVPQNGGQFYVDDITGKIAFRKEDCPGNFLLSCVSATAQPNVLDNAVSASSVTYSDEWYFNDRQLASIDQPEGSNEFETGQLGKWRVKNSYVYKSELFETGQNLSNGTFTLEDFTWRYEDANNPKKWIRSSSIEQYSINGEAIQERNVLDIPSTAKFGYHGALPYLTAQNAEYEDVYFESFENTYGTELEEGVLLSENGLNITTEFVHSGRKAAEFSGFYKQPILSLSQQIKANGILLKAWVRLESESDLSGLQFKVTDADDNEISAELVNVVARVGEWKLVTSRITDFGALQTSEFREDADLFKTGLIYTGSGKCWIDDLRIQPGDVQMTAYVYDPRNFRLLTVFDDQHFGLYYQYDGEGKLVRKQIETERGIKTVQETHYNIPKEDRGE